MATFSVHVTIENKPGISDPEGDTILNDLVLKGTHKNISKIKTAKMLKFTIQEKDKKTLKSFEKIIFFSRVCSLNFNHLKACFLKRKK